MNIDVQKAIEVLSLSLSDRQCSLLSLIVDIDKPFDGKQGRYDFLKLINIQSLIAHKFLDTAECYSDEYNEAYCKAIEGL